MFMEDWGLRWHLPIAILQPLVALGLVLGGSYERVFGTDPGLGAVLTIVGWLTWLLSIALEARPGLTFVGSVALLVALVAVGFGMDTSALHTRGVRTTCTVLNVAKRTETTTDYDSTTHTTSTTTHTYYDYQLQCADNHINAMTLSSRASADKGQQLAVTYDPHDRVDPKPSDDVTDGSGWLMAAWISLGISVLARVIGVVWEALDPW